MCKLIFNFKYGLVFFLIFGVIGAVLAQNDIEISDPRVISFRAVVNEARKIYKKDDETLEEFARREASTQQSIKEFVKNSFSSLLLSFFDNNYLKFSLQEVKEIVAFLEREMPEDSRLKITHLQLSEASSTLAMELAALFPNVTSLNISGFYRCDDSDLEGIAKAFPGLSALSLKSHVYSKFEGIPSLWKKNLQSLTLTGELPASRGRRRHSIISIFDSEATFERLETLNLDGMFLSEQGLYRSRFPVLKTLSLKGAKRWGGWKDAQGFDLVPIRELCQF